MNNYQGYSSSTDAVTAAQQLYDSIKQDNIALAIFYCSPNYDLDLLAKTLHELFAGTPLIGCTTAGEIGPNGIQKNSLVGVSLSADDFTVATQLITDLDSFSIGTGMAACHQLIEEIEKKIDKPESDKLFFLNLIDGMSKKEEHMLSAINAAGLNIPLIGGSAADGENFGSTAVYYQGEFHTNASLLTLLHTDLPFVIFKENAYEETSSDLIITGIDEKTRVILEFNGEPAAQEYARMIDREPHELNFSLSSNHPLALKYGDELYIRTIIFPTHEETTAELPYTCALEEGMILHVTKPLDTYSSLVQKFNEIKDKIGEVSLTLGFDCICRQFIYASQGKTAAVSNLMKEHNLLGFHTYGEQYYRAHVNQTLTGIAFGKRAK